MSQRERERESETKRSLDLFNILRQETLLINLTDVDRNWTEDVIIILEAELRGRVKQVYVNIKSVSRASYHFSVTLQTLEQSCIYVYDGELNLQHTRLYSNYNAINY